MLKQVYDVNSDGFVIKIDTADVDESGNILDEDKKHMIAVYYPPYYKPKWNGTEWIEGATQEYIDEMNKVEPTPPNQEERIDMLENMILLMMEGQ